MATDLAEFDRRVEAVVRELTAHPERLRLVPAIVEDVQRALRTRWPDCSVKPFGSTINGTASRASDLDLTVVFADGAAGTGVSAEDARYATLAGATLREHPHLFTDVDVPDKLYKTATCVHAPTGASLDVSFRRVMNVQNTAVVRYFLNLDQRAFRLAVIIKRWAEVTGVKKRHRDHAGRAFTNYNIILLVIFYLQQRRVLPPVAELQRGTPPLYIEGWNAAFEERDFHTDNTESLVALLGGFFEYYEGFDYGRYAISVFTGFPVERRALDPRPGRGRVPPLPPELVAYRTHPPVDTSPAFLMLECFDYNQPSGSILDLEQFEIAAEAYRHLNNNDFLNFLLH